MQLRTLLKLDKSLSGDVVELSEGYANLRLNTDSRMVADDMGLVHGGFSFSLADFCAMAGVNEPNVGLAQASIRYLKPVKVGEEIFAEGRIIRVRGKVWWAKRRRKIVRRDNGKVVEFEEYPYKTKGKKAAYYRKEKHYVRYAYTHLHYYWP